MTWTMPEAVIFDLDDTLSDHLHSARAGIEALRQRHPALMSLDLAELDARYSRSLEHHHRRMLDGEISQSQSRLARLHDLFGSVGIHVSDEAALVEYAEMRAAYDAAARVVPGARSVLDELVDRSVRLAIITNNLVADQTRKLSELKLTDYFEVITISEAVGVAKPAPEIFHTTLDALALRPADAVMVGDSLTSDIAGADGVGMRSVWLDRLTIGAPIPDNTRRLVGDLSDTDQVVAALLAAEA